MTEADLPVPRVVRTRVPRRPIAVWSPAMSMLLFAVLCGVGLALTPADVRKIAAPGVVMIVLGVFFAWRLYARDRVLPLFEIGSLAVLATIMYAVVPLMNYIAGGLQWIPYSDSRLMSYGWTTPDLHLFGWRWVLYLSALAFSYLIVRGRATAMGRTLSPIKRTYAISMLIIVGSVELFVIAVEMLYGINLRPSHAEITVQGVRTIWDLPLFVNQISHNLMGMSVIIKYWLVALVLMEWRRPEWRAIFFGWLGLELVLTVVKLGARGELVLLLMAAALLYHRLVKPLRLRLLLPVAVAFLAAFFLYGAVRDMNVKVQQVTESEYPFLAYPNEFQALFGTAYDLHMRKEAGILPPVPWQIYVADAYMIIPSQLLPFDKIDPAGWYLQVAGIQGAGFMFGVMSQAVLGFDWVELFLRGLVLGIVLALLHRWYVRHQGRFWATMTYLFFCIWVFYTVRQSTFSPLYFFLYRFVGAVIAVRVLSFVLDVPRRVVRAVGPTR